MERTRGLDAGKMINKRRPPIWSLFSSQFCTESRYMCMLCRSVRPLMGEGDRQRFGLFRI